MSALRNTFRNRVGATLAAAALAFTPVSSATANDDAPQMTQVAVTGPAQLCSPDDRSLSTALGQARCFSMENNAIGFVVIGHASNGTNDQIINHIEGRFSDQNLAAQPFSMMPEREGVTVVFFLQGSQFGPELDWQSEYDEVVRIARTDGYAQLAAASESNPTFALR